MWFCLQMLWLMERNFFSLLFYWFHITDECFMGIIHLSIFFKFIEDLTFLLVKVRTVIVGVWMVTHGVALVSAGFSFAVLSLPLHDQWACSQLVSDELTEPVLKVLTKRYRCLCDDLWGICGWRGNVEIGVAVVAKCRNRNEGVAITILM